MFTFVHLSDIHFNRWSSDQYDLDQDLRDEFQRDLFAAAELLRTNVDALLVTGDIAYSGKRVEYEIASAWLDVVSAGIGCSAENIWVTPGNHDVDRDVVSGSKLLRTVHEYVLSQEPRHISNAISDHCHDKISGEVLFRPLEEYNSFAHRFGCRIDNDRPYWEHEKLAQFGEDVELKLRGINTVLVSSAADKERSDKGPGNLVMGEFQVPPRQDGVVFITMCHHPVSWLRDESVIAPFIDRRAAIQLYGHTHEFQVQALNGRLRLNAGALHPERHEENWEPRYNVLQMQRIDGDLKVTVYPRVWDSSKHEFTSGTTIDFVAQEHILPFTLVPKATLEKKAGQKVENPEPEFEKAAVDPIAQDTDMRRLLFRYMRLSFHERFRIAQQLDLFEEADENVSDSEKFQRVLRRVRDRGIPMQFLAAIEESEKQVGK